MPLFMDLSLGREHHAPDSYEIHQFLIGFVIFFLFTSYCVWMMIIFHSTLPQRQIRSVRVAPSPIAIVVSRQERPQPNQG